MNALSPIRAGLNPISSLPTLRSEPAAAARILRPGDVRELTPATSPASAPQAPSSPSFGNLLGRMVAEVNAKQVTASQAVAGLQSGQSVNLHQAMISMEEASVSFQLMAEVRNKLLESYQEIMRMQV